MMLLALSILENLKSVPISFIPNVEIEVDIELGVFHYIITHPKDLEEPMSPTQIVKKKKCDHEIVWHFQGKWAKCLPWVEYILHTLGMLCNLLESKMQRKTFCT
jgi:hypothetical protein